MHEGCVIDSEAEARRYSPGVPAYFIPRDR